MFLYNIHTPQKTFAIQHKDGESFQSLISRIVSKSGISSAEQKAIQERKDGAGVVYEFEGERWSLEDGEYSTLGVKSCTEYRRRPVHPSF